MRHRWGATATARPCALKQSTPATTLDWKPCVSRPGSYCTARCATTGELQHGAVRLSKAPQQHVVRAQARALQSRAKSRASGSTGMRTIASTTAAPRRTARCSAVQHQERARGTMHMFRRNPQNTGHAHPAPGCPHISSILTRVYMHEELHPQEGAPRSTSFGDLVCKHLLLGAFPP